MPDCIIAAVPKSNLYLVNYAVRELRRQALPGFSMPPYSLPVHCFFCFFPSAMPRPPISQILAANCGANKPA